MGDRYQAYQAVLDRYQEYQAELDDSQESRAMLDRYRGFVSVLGSAHLEDALPSPDVIELGERWALGEITIDELSAAADRVVAGLPLTGEGTAGEPARLRPSDA